MGCLGFFCSLRGRSRLPIANSSKLKLLPAFARRLPAISRGRFVIAADQSASAATSAPWFASPTMHIGLDHRCRRSSYWWRHIGLDRRLHRARECCVVDDRADLGIQVLGTRVEPLFPAFAAICASMNAIGASLAASTIGAIPHTTQRVRRRTMVLFSSPYRYDCPLGTCRNSDD